MCHLAGSTTAAGLHGGVPGGTIASFITACENIPRNHLALASCDWALSPMLSMRLHRGPLVFCLGRLCGGLFVFCLSNRAIVQRTAGLLELAHLSNVHAASPAYGPAFTSGRQRRPLTGPQKPPNHRHERLVVGWEWLQLQNGKRTARLPPNQTKMEQGQNDG